MFNDDCYAWGGDDHEWIDGTNALPLFCLLSNYFIEIFDMTVGLTIIKRVYTSHIDIFYVPTYQ